MRICLVLEGSYPYVHGGVSTWMHQYIQAMPDIEFVIWSICAKEENKGQYVYDLPENVVEVVEVSLEQEVEIGQPFNQADFTPAERSALRNLVFLQDLDWKVLFEILQEGRVQPSSFLESKFFYRCVEELCKERFVNISFSDVFHTVRSMLFPLLHLLASPVPVADAYHSISTGYGGILATLGSLSYEKPLLLTEHGIYTREREEELLRAEWVPNSMKENWIRFFYFLSQAIYQEADAITSLFGNARLTQIELGCSPEKTRVIPNGIDYPRFSGTPLKEEDGWVDIGAVIRLSQIKDVKTLIYSFMELSQKLPHVRLHIMGGVDDPEYAQECYQLVERLGLERIIFTGRVDILSYMEKLDMTVLSSLSEAQPLSVLESLAAGRPSVTTDVGCCKELLEGTSDDLGQAGLVVPPTDASALAAALSQLCQSKDLRLAFGAVGKKRVEDFYQYPKMIASYRALYKEFV